MNTDLAALLARDVERTLTTAGLAIADLDDPGPSGFARAGVGVSVADMRIHDGEWAVMLTWGMSDDADYRTAAIMLAAVAEVLRVHGYKVEQHPVGLAYLVTGRGKVSIDDLTGPPVWETNPDGVWPDA
jgi:hypothetical protein